MLFRSILVTPSLFGCASTHLLLFCQKIIWFIQRQEDDLQHTNYFRQAAETGTRDACAPSMQIILVTESMKTRFAAKKAWSYDALEIEKAGDGVNQQREDHGIKSKGKHAVQQR